jgi:phosphoribosyl-ATP pyrophosphohydrolase
MTIDELFKIIESRKLKMPEGSYLTSLFKAGQDRIIQKVGEEAIEVVIAAKNKDKQKIISEVADLWFHVLIMLSTFKINPSEVLDELEKRSK